MLYTPCQLEMMSTWDGSLNLDMFCVAFLCFALFLDIISLTVEHFNIKKQRHDLQLSLKGVLNLI